MDLQEEYIRRRKVSTPVVRYVEKASLILRAKEGKQVPTNLLHLSIDYRQDTNHPSSYQFVVSANPVIYSTVDFSNFAYQHTKILLDQKWEWDQYESNLLAWVATNAESYVAIPSSEAVLVSCQLFLTNHDSWFANFMPCRVIDQLVYTLTGETASKISYINHVEEWLKSKYERVYACWKNIRQSLDNRNYADWLADIVNRKGTK